MANTCPYIYNWGDRCSKEITDGQEYCESCRGRMAAEAKGAKDASKTEAQLHPDPTLPEPYPSTLEGLKARLQAGGDEIDAINWIQLTAKSPGSIWGLDWNETTRTFSFKLYSLDELQNIVGKRFNLSRVKIKAHNHRSGMVYTYKIPSLDPKVSSFWIDYEFRKGFVEWERRRGWPGPDPNFQPARLFFSGFGWMELFGRP